jgi:hypothetical protein
LLPICLTVTGVGAEPPDEAEPGLDEPRSVVAREVGPRFSLHGFADVGAFQGAVPSTAPNDPAEDFFAIGELDLYIVSGLSDHLSFLGELVFELDSQDEFVVDVERLFLKYTFSDRAWLSFGRRHTPLGYWNETFHHGRYLEPTVERPSALRFEDDGGILPVHTVGLAAGGRVFARTWGLDYVGGLGNGRGVNREDVQSARDVNDTKAAYLKLSVTRFANSQLQFGPMIYVDDIPGDPMIPGRMDELDERILGLHFHYRSRKWELFSEYYNIRHDDVVGGTTYDNDSYYAIAVWRPWKWKPYVGIDNRTLDPGDPFFADLPPDFMRYLGGVRWDMGPFHALKFEYRYDEYAAEEVTVDSLAFQAAFTF